MAGEGTALLLVLGLGLGGILVYTLTNKGALQGILGNLTGGGGAGDDEMAALPQQPDEEDMAPMPPPAAAGLPVMGGGPPVPSEMKTPQPPSILKPPVMMMSPLKLTSKEREMTRDHILDIGQAKKVIHYIVDESDKKGLSKVDKDDLKDALVDHVQDLVTMGDDNDTARALALTIINELQNPLQVQVRRAKRGHKLNVTITTPRKYKVDIKTIKSRAGWSDYQ